MHWFAKSMCAFCLSSDFDKNKSWEFTFSVIIYELSSDGEASDLDCLHLLLLVLRYCDGPK